jgi:phosphatidylglycerophosphatase C
MQTRGVNWCITLDGEIHQFTATCLPISAATGAIWAENGHSSARYSYPIVRTCLYLMIQPVDPAFSSLAQTPVAAHPEVVAAFDFDGTISTCDSLQVFLRNNLGRPKFGWAIFRALPWLTACALHLTDRHTAKEHLLRASLGGRRAEQVERWAADFVAGELPGLLRPEMLARLAWHQAQGHRTVLVSASPSLYLRPWAQKMGFQALLCTELEVVDGFYTGRLASRNCWGPEKVRRLEAWWQQDVPAKLYAYGDSRGDAEMLARADVAWYRGVEQSRAA